jgi:hypothetical protein
MSRMRFLLIFFFEILIFYFLLSILKFIPLNLIWGSFFINFTLVQGILPSLGAISPLYFLFYIFSCISKNFVFKIPSMAAGLIFFVYKNIKNKSIELIFNIFIFIFILFLDLFIYFNYKIPFIYTIGWKITLFLILFFSKNIFVLSFISLWTAHIVGTLIYIIFGQGLSYDQYVILFPISWVERLFLILVSFSFYKLVNIVRFNINMFLLKEYINKIKSYIKK